MAMVFEGLRAVVGIVKRLSIPLQALCRGPVAGLRSDCFTVETAPIIGWAGRFPYQVLIATTRMRQLAAATSYFFSGSWPQFISE